MSSRGHFIGQIIDDLDAIASKVKRRCDLNKTDLNVVLETFFKDLLNLVRNRNLRNLNATRSNEPGLDLGDPAKGFEMAFQITSQAGAPKINDMLSKITDEQLATYKNIYVLIIGKRQGSYQLNKTDAARCKFDESHILGITELCREIMDLDLPALHAVHRMVADEQRGVLIELESRVNGTYETDVLAGIETDPDVVHSDGGELFRHPETSGLFGTKGEAQVALDAFIAELARLPRSTREFFGWLIDNSDQRLRIGSQRRQINADLVAGKTSNFKPAQAELRLLEARSFIDYDQDDDHRSGN